MRQFLLPMMLLFVFGMTSCMQQNEDDDPYSPYNTDTIGQLKGVKTAAYTVRGKRYYPMSAQKALQYDEVGYASHYGRGKRGERTASGEYMRAKSAMSAAHKTLPLPCVVKVTCLQTGKSCLLRVNDRGPFVSNRLIDVSPNAAVALGLKGRGIGKVRVQVVSVGDGKYKITK